MCMSHVNMFNMHMCMHMHMHMHMCMCMHTYVTCLHMSASKLFIS